MNEEEKARLEELRHKENLTDEEREELRELEEKEEPVDKSQGEDSK